MARTEKKVKKTARKTGTSQTSRRTASIQAAPIPDMYTPTEAAANPEPKPNTRRSLLTVLLFAIALLIVYLVKNGYVVSAIVDGSPIFAWNLSSQLRTRFGEQTLEGLITEKLIDKASREANITVSPEDIDKRENEMLANVGENISLDDLLKYQGITKADFDKQVKMQLAVEKILGQDVEITESAIDQYIASNSARMEATTEADLREEAEKALFDQEVSGRVNTWFSELKEKARILRFL